MDPISLITGAITIADTLGLDEWFGELVGGEPGAKAASKVVDMAKSVTNTGSIEGAIAELKENKLVANELKKQLVNNKHELQLAVYEDLKSARQMYQSTDHAMADKIADEIITKNPKLILLLILTNICVVLWVTNPAIAIAAGNVIGASITYLWQERQSVVGFFFGSSQGSKQKAIQLQNKPN
jgi:hypothetical protein